VAEGIRLSALRKSYDTQSGRIEAVRGIDVDVPAWASPSQSSNGCRASTGPSDSESVQASSTASPSRALLSHYPQARDIEVQGAWLEEAFLHLSGPRLEQAVA
jgi:hypothetical protein